MSLISDIAIWSIARGVRLPKSKRVSDFHQLARTIDLINRLDINVFLDVGANRGFFSRNLRSAGYSGLLLSFEPIRSECAQIKRLAENDVSWLAFDCALGAEDGTKQFNIFVTEGQTVLSSFLSMKDAPTESVTVSVQRLDTLLPSLLGSITSPRIFLKMDTQGFDHEVMKGAGSWTDRIYALQSEVSVTPLYEGMWPYTRSLQNYHDLGFQLIDMFVVNRDDDGKVIEYDCLMARP